TEGLQPGHLLFAGSAPGGPGVQQHNITLQVLQRDGVAGGEVGGLEIWCGGGRSVARQQEQGKQSQPEQGQRARSAKRKAMHVLRSCCSIRRSPRVDEGMPGYAPARWAERTVTEEPAHSVRLQAARIRLLWAVANREEWRYQSASQPEG